MKQYPPVEVLRQLFTVDESTGAIFRKSNGKRADHPSKDYRRVFINRVAYAAHRIVWAMNTGSYPEVEIDHINRDKNDNRIANLRSATKSENAANRVMPRRLNHDLPKGVVRHSSGKYQSQICVSGKYIYLGLFSTIDAASAAYGEAATLHFGEYASPLND